MTRIRTLAAIVATAAVLLLAAPAQAVDPSTNTSPNGLYNCDVNSSLITSACLSGAVADFNRARAKEHLYGINLPVNFAFLPVSYQLLILANIDRADRGLATFIGLSKTLNTYALQGAQTNSDPSFPSWTSYGAGNWVGSVNSFWGEYEWMYDDGPGSSNVDCRPSNMSGCWGHRHNIVMNWPNPMFMGAATANGGAATIVLGRDTHDRADLFLWSSEYSQFGRRGQPVITVRGGVGALSLSIYRESQTYVSVQRYYSRAWHPVAIRTTGGTSASGGTWGTSLRLAAGTYRVVTAESSRFLKAVSKNVAVH